MMYFFIESLELEKKIKDKFTSLLYGKKAIKRCVQLIQSIHKFHKFNDFRNQYIYLHMIGWCMRYDFDFREIEKLLK